MRRAGRGIERIGAVLVRESDLQVAPSTATSPIAQRDWEAAVGSRIAARAKPIRIDRGVLYVRAATAAWAQELALLEDAIRAQLKGRGVAVASIRFWVGALDAPARSPTRSEEKSSPKDAPLPTEVKVELARVSDPNLRDAIARAAAKNLGWQEKNAKDAAKERAATSARSAARALRSAAPESAPPDRTSRERGAAPRANSGSASRRRP